MPRPRKSSSRRDTRDGADAWETVIAPRSELRASFAIRRIRVPGGWLYQVEHHVEAGSDNQIRFVDWHPPVFVAEMHRDSVDGSGGDL